MIKRAYIHEYGGNKMEQEHQDVLDVLKARGIQCELFTTKILSRNQLALDGETFVAGDNPVILTVLRRMGLAFSHDSYPKSLEKYWGRKIWATTIHALLSQNSFNEVLGIFVKPRAVAKLFTGFVINSECDLFQLGVFSKNTALYCSTLVRWRSEYRVFVRHSKLVGIKHYAGDASLKMEMATVTQAIADFEQSADRTAAYGMDFGVLDTGQTTLVE